MNGSDPFPFSRFIILNVPGGCVMFGGVAEWSLVGPIVCYVNAITTFIVYVLRQWCEELWEKIALETHLKKLI